MLFEKYCRQENLPKIFQGEDPSLHFKVKCIISSDLRIPSQKQGEPKKSKKVEFCWSWTSLLQDLQALASLIRHVAVLTH